MLVSELSETEVRRYLRLAVIAGGPDCASALFYRHELERRQRDESHVELVRANRHGRKGTGGAHA